VKFRSLDAIDAAPAQRLIHLTIDSSYPGAYPPRAVQFFKAFHSLDRILERCTLGQVLVIEQDEDVIATGAIVADEITGVFVHPQSQKLGIGGRLMDRLENIARIGGHESVQLAVSLPSRGFYESRGYQLLKNCSIDVGEGERLDYWEAEKSWKTRGCV